MLRPIRLQHLRSNIVQVLHGKTFDKRIVMQEYMNERLDLKRYMLLNRKRWIVVVIMAVIGAVIFGGVYFVKAVLMAGPDTYRCKAMYYITFDTEEYEVVHDFYNDFTWNTVLDSDQIGGKVAEKLGMDKNKLAEVTLIPTMSDIRMIWLYVDMEDKAMAEQVQLAFKDELASFSQVEKGFESIELWDGPETTLLENPVFVPRNVVFGAIAGAVVGLLILLYMNAKDSSIYTFEDFSGRYGEYPLGTIFKNSKNYANESLKEHMEIFMKENAIEEMNVFYSEALSEGDEADFDVDVFKKKIVGDGIKVNFLKHSEDEDFFEKVKGDVTNVMLVRAGNDDYGALTHAVNNAKVLGIAIRAYILVDCDEIFYKAYYKSKNKEEK